MKGYEYRINKKNNNKAITLIALVITIIVLLILAGVSIGMLTGDKGILTQANNAKTENKKGEESDQIGLAFNAARMKKISKGNESDITAAELQAELNYNGITEVEVTGTGKLKVKFTDTENVYTVEQDGIIKEYDENKGVLAVPEDSAEVYDISANGDGSVMAYLVEREGETDKYDMLIIGEGAMSNEYYLHYTPAPYYDYINSIITVKISNGVSNIGRSAFYHFTSLTSVTIPDSVISIGNDAFSGCTSLVNVTIPESVTSIGSQALFECTSLENIIYEGTQAQWEIVTLGFYWASGVKATAVQCSDVTVNI